MVGAVAVAALVVGAVVTGWVRSTGAPAGGPPVPSAPPTFRVDPAADGGAGLNVRYLDADGTVHRLDVKDFPR